MHKTPYRTFGAAVFALALAAGAAPAMATDLRMLSSWDSTYPIVPNVAELYMQMVRDASDGATTIAMTGPEAVPPFEQLQPVATGVFDILFTSGAYHSNETAVGMVLDAVRGDPAGRRESGLWESVDEAYRALGLKLLALPTLVNGYQLVLREPIGEDCTLEGRKIRGTATYMRLIQSLGAQPVVLPAGETYSALEKGVVDGAAWTVIGPLDYGWFEVADYLVRPAFGTTTYMMLMNLDAWTGLEQAEQEVLLAQGRALEDAAMARLADVAAREEAAMLDKGMTITRMCGDAAATMEHDWAEGIWDLGAEKGGAAIAALKEKVDAAGLDF